MKHLRQYWLIKVLLYPFAVLYGLLTDLRNLLYDWKLCKVERFERPVISVGNITAGGSGKTPFTMLLIELFAGQHKLAVVSRGYGRKSRGLLVASDGAGNIAPVEQSGDEPGLIARRYRQIPILVAEHRSQGINEVIRLFNPQLILLDDAFQHRRAGRNCDIVLISAATTLSKERMLPLGNLREKLNNLKRADMIVISGDGVEQKEMDLRVIRKYYQGELYQCFFRPACLVDANLSRTGPLEDLHNQNCLAFTAIAHPRQFKTMLLEIGARVHLFESFADHHFFSVSDQKRIVSTAQTKNITTVVTTEKDIVKLDRALFTGLNLIAVRRQGSIEEPLSFLNNLCSLIDLKN